VRFLLLVLVVKFDVTVVDRHGHSMDEVVLQPVSDGGSQGLVKMGANGRYSGGTESGRIVVRRRGYVPVVVRPAVGVRVVMEALAPVDGGRICTREPEGYPVSILRFKRGRTKAVDMEGDDTAGTTYFVRTRSGEEALQHRWGAAWSVGVPSEADVRMSTEYEERAYLVGKDQITDARGVLPDGSRWRFLGHLGESAAYRTKDAAAARRFDAILDGVCFARR